MTVLNITDVQPPDTCWVWWGPSWHRMRCRKKPGHDRAHSCHNDCGEMSESGAVCGDEPDHTGPHAWELTDKPAPRRGDKETPRS